jgi:hypothetical protein
LTLVFLLCIASAPIHGVTRQQDSANDALIKPCCGPGIENARADDRNKAVRDTRITDLPDSVSLPLDINRALDRTLEDILDEAERTLERFNTLRLGSDLFLGLDADVDDRVIHRFGMLVHRLSQRISELREAADAALPERLSNQAENLRRDAVRLFIAARRLDLLMQARDHCGLRNLGIFLSAVETLALEPETRRTGTTAPTLHYFFFEGQLPNVVPPDGGWLVLHGSGLWQGDDSHVTLIDPERETTVAVLEVHQTGDDATAAVKIEPEWIADNAGRCLSLRARNNIVNSMHWWKQPKPAAYSDLPVCIPQSFDTQYRIAGFLEYRTPTQTRHLTSRAILFENASCVDRKQVSESLEWTLDQGGWLIDMDESPLYEAGASSIDCKLEENRIICSGTLGKAVCSQTFHSGDSGDANDLLLEQAEWEHIFTPIAEFPLEEEHRSWALSGVVDPGLPVTEVAVMIPREESSEQTTIWYELIVVNGGQQKTVFVSPRKDLLEMEQDSYTTDHDRMIADLDPAPGSAEAGIHVSIDPATCPY